MTEQKERLRRALRGCAEEGVPDAVDLWPVISERVSAEKIPGEQTAWEQVSPRRRVWPTQLVPNTPLGWVFALISVLIIGAGVYAVSGPVRELLRQGLPGTVEVGSDKDAGQAPSTQPDVNLSALRTELDQTKTADGVRVTLDWAYADERYVAVGLHTQRLDDARGSQQPEPVVYEPSLWDDTHSNEADLPPYVKITDSSGQDFDTVGGGTLLGPGRTGADATFDAPEGIAPGRSHHFRLEVPLIEEFRKGSSDKPVAGPFVFDFEIPVRPAPTIELNQRVRAEGIEMTLEKVVDSPVVPQAVVCFEPPDDEHSWTPWFKDDGHYAKVGSAPQNLGDGCWSLTMDSAVEGHSSVTVAYLEGMPRGGLPSGAKTFHPKRISGPWIFEFEAPER